MTDQLETEIIIDPIFGAQAVSKIKKQSEKTGKIVGKKFEKGLKKGTNNAFSGLTRRLTGLGAALGAAFAARGIVSAVAQIDKLETSLGGLLGSAGAASKELQALQDFAASTPFQLLEIGKSASKLIAFGRSLEQVNGDLKTLGDVAAGSGSQLGEVALIFGQISAAGKLTGERLLQLEERAIPVADALRKALKNPTADIRALASEGKISFKLIEEAFGSMTSAGGLFEDATLKQSRTVGGVLSTLGDNFFNLQAQLGRTFGPAIISGAQEFITIFQNLTAAVKSNGPSLIKTFASMVDVLLITPSKFWAEFLSGSAGSSLARVETELKAANEQLAITQRKLAKQEGNFFGDFLGGTKESKAQIMALQLQILELDVLKRQLSGSTSAATLAAEKEAEAQRKAAAAMKARALEERRLISIRASLGTVGLTRIQQLEQQFNAELLLLTNARTNEAITEEEFNARRLERTRLHAEQMAGAKKPEIQSIIAGLTAAETAAVNAETTMGQSFNNLDLGFKAFAKSAKTNSIKIAAVIGNGIGQGASNAFKAFGAALVSGENALAAFGKALLKTFANVLVKLGEGFILQGVAESLAGFGSGAALIAAGAALVTFGSIAGAVISGGSSSGGASAGAGGGVASQDTETGTTLTAQVEEREEPDTRVSLNINGDVFDSEQTGIRISQILSESFQTNGVVISNGNFA